MRFLDRATIKICEPIPIKESLIFTDHLSIEVVEKNDTNKLILTVYSETKDENGLLVIGPPKHTYLTYRFFQRFPIKAKRKSKNYAERYEVPFTDLSLAIIENVWPRVDSNNTFTNRRPELGESYVQTGVKVNVSFVNDKSRSFYELKTLLEKQGDANAKRTAAFKEHGEVDFWTTIRKNKDLPPGPHQEAAAINCVNMNTALWKEQGTGKTLVGIMVTETEAARKIDADENPYRVLVLCPKNVRLNWSREFTKFATLPHKTTIIRGKSASQRMAEVATGLVPFNGEKYVVTIMGYESYVRTEQFLKNIEWDLVLLDESHSIANPRTDRTKAILRLRRNSKKRIPMTGTPYKNSIIDLFPQLEFLYQGASGANSLEEFRSMHTESERLQSGVSVLTGYKNIPMLQERISRYAFMVTKKEVMPNLPEKTFDIIECSMSHKQSQVYRQVASELYAELNDELTGETNSLTVNNVLTQLLRLAQITSGYVVWDAEIDNEGNVLKDQQFETFETTANTKMEVLMEELKSKKPWQKTQIWCCFTENIKKIAARCRLEGIDCVTYYGATSDKDRQLAEDRFNNDNNCKVFIGHPKAGGTGLNLLGYNRDNPPESIIDGEDTNCDHVMYYSYNWSYADRAQSQDRAHRRGTRVPVRISTLLVPGSIDQEINSRVEAKKQTGLSITDVRHLLGRIVESNPIENGD